MTELLNSKGTLLLPSPTTSYTLEPCKHSQLWQSPPPCRSHKAPNARLTSWVVWNLIDTVFPYIYVNFHLKEACYGSSLAYPKCQHHCSCAWGPSPRKIVWFEHSLKERDTCVCVYFHKLMESCLTKVIQIVSEKFQVWIRSSEQPVSFLFHLLMTDGCHISKKCNIST